MIDKKEIGKRKGIVGGGVVGVILNNQLKGGKS